MIQQLDLDVRLRMVMCKVMRSSNIRLNFGV